MEINLPTSKLAHVALPLILILELLSGTGFRSGSVSLAKNDLTNTFDPCQCVAWAYQNAPKPIQQLIKWTQGISFDGHPKPPSWVQWYAWQWAENIRTYGPQFDSKLDWSRAVNHTPVVGAIVMFPAGTTTTWKIGAQKSFWTFDENGHVAVVTAYDPSKKTINTSDKNWGTCGPTVRENIDINADMIFIHPPAPIIPAGDSSETVKIYKTQFSAKLPLRQIWVSTRSKFELTIDGKSIMTEDRPKTWDVFTQKITVTPLKTHSVEIKWWQIGLDPEPEFLQTFWPNVVVMAAEPSPSSSLPISYTYFVNPNTLVKDQTATISVAAITDLPFKITSIDIFANEKKIGTTSGPYGTITIPTNSLSPGRVKIRMVAVLPDWPGKVADKIIDVTLLDSVTQKPASSLRGTVLQRSQCRYGPSQYHLYKTGFKQQAPVEIIGRDVDGGWLHIQIRGGNQPCWINASLVQVEGDIMALPDQYPPDRRLPISDAFPQITLISASPSTNGVTASWVAFTIRVDLQQTGEVEYVIEVWTCKAGKPAFYAVGTNDTFATFQVDNSCGVSSYAHLIGQDEHGFSFPTKIPLP